MTSVHTQYGPGEIVASDTVRGRTQYKVAGPGFEVWVDETAVPQHLGFAPVDFDNSVALPYDPTPQYPAIPGDVESTLQPIHEIDADERLDSVDSVTFEHRTYDEGGPRPAPDSELFAKGAATERERYRDKAYSQSRDRGRAEHERQDLGRAPTPESGQDWLDEWGPGAEEAEARRRSLGHRQAGWQQTPEKGYGVSPYGEGAGAPNDYGAGPTEYHDDWMERNPGEHPADSPYFDELHPEVQQGILDHYDIGAPMSETEAYQNHRSGENPYDVGEGGTGPLPGPGQQASPYDYPVSGPGSGKGDDPEAPWNRNRRGSLHEAILPALVAPAVAGAAEAGTAGAAAGGAGGGLASGLARGLALQTPGLLPGGRGKAKAEKEVKEMLPSADKPLPVPDLATGGWGDLAGRNGSLQRPAGLSDKYIDIEASADYYNDPVAQFRNDPVGYINRVGHVEDEGLDPRFASYVDLVESDRIIREAAWKDVRKKALRLRREGKVHVKDIGDDRIYASVEGDNGTYDTMIAKGGAFGGFGGGHAISNWRCSCLWGQWAFRRRYTYVGRFCSHGYASYLEMQSQHTKGKGRLPKQTKPYTKRRTAQEGDDPLNPGTVSIPIGEAFGPPGAQGPPGTLAPGTMSNDGAAAGGGHVDHVHQPLASRHEADALQMIPTRLTPEMVIQDTDDTAELVDVTKDERQTVGPDQIVHFSRLMTHCDHYRLPYPRELVGFLYHYANAAAVPEDPDAAADAADATDTDTDTDVDADATDTDTDTDADAAADAAATDTDTTTDEEEEEETAATDEEDAAVAAAGPAGVGTTPAVETPGAQGGGMGDMGGMMETMGPALGAGLGAAADIGSEMAPMVGDIAGQVVPMIGDLAGNIGGMIGGIFGHKLAGPFPDPRPDHDAFAGSGPQPPLVIHPSADYVDDAKRDDVTDIGHPDVYGDESGLEDYRTAAYFYAQGDDRGDGGGVGGGAPAAGAGIGGVGAAAPTGGSAAVPPSPDTAAGVTPSAGDMAAGGATWDATTPGLGRAAYHYADDQTTQDWKVKGTGEARKDLEWLRDEAEDDPYEHLGEMEEHVDDIREHVEDAREHGVDASPLVASYGGGIKRAGKGPKRPPVVPQVVRIRDGQGIRSVAAQHVDDDFDPLAPRTAAQYEAPEGGDLVAAFQRSAAAADLMMSGGGGSSEYDDIAGAASAHLKTAGRQYSLAEQAELMNEKHPLGARNLASLDLEGTHYEAENSVGLW